MRMTTSNCRECKKLATETTRHPDGTVVRRHFPNGPVVQIKSAMSIITIHVACRQEFLKRVSELQPLEPRP